MLASSARVRAPYFRSKLATWYFTVFAVIPSWSPIRWFEIPVATKRSTCFSRSVSSSAPSTVSAALGGSSGISIRSVVPPARGRLHVHGSVERHHSLHDRTQCVVVRRHCGSPVVTDLHQQVAAIAVPADPGACCVRAVDQREHCCAGDGAGFPSDRARQRPSSCRRLGELDLQWPGADQRTQFGAQARERLGYRLEHALLLLMDRTSTDECGGGDLRGLPARGRIRESAGAEHGKDRFEGDRMLISLLGQGTVPRQGAGTFQRGRDVAHSATLARPGRPTRSNGAPRSSGSSGPPPTGPRWSAWKNEASRIR